MTRKAVMPDWREEKQKENENVYVGGEFDIGDNGFVFSFHVHSENRVKCEQYIKTQRVPFYPHYMIDMWPMYFHAKFKQIDDKLDRKYVHEHWRLQSHDRMLMVWIKLVDIDLYKYLEKNHIAFLQETQK